METANLTSFCGGDMGDDDGDDVSERAGGGHAESVCDTNSEQAHHRCYLPSAQVGSFHD